MTQLTISDTIHSITVDDPVYNVNVSVDDTVYTVEIASSAADTQVITSGSGTSLINTSTGGITTLNSVTAGSNVTIVDDDAGNLTIAAGDTEDDLSNNDTDDLSEGSTNLYYTDTRADARITAADTDDLSEGSTNLYYTDTRANNHADNVKSNYGTGDDMHIMFDSANGVLRLPSAGDMYHGASTHYFQNADWSKTSATFHPDTAVNLYYDNALKLNTTSTGATVTGILTATSFIGDVTGTVSSVANLDTDDLSEGSTNLYYTDTRADARAESKDVARMVTSDAYADASEAAAISTAAATAAALDTTQTAANKILWEAYADQAEADAEATAAADATAKVAVLTSGASSAFDTLVEIKNLMDAGDTTLTNSIAALNHDTLSGFVANEHIDWTVTGNTIHADNYTDTNTTYTAGTNVSIDGSNVISATDTNTNTTYTAGTGLTLAGTVFSLTSGHFDGAYGSLTGAPTIPSGNQIIDWTTDQGSTNLHAGNYTDTNTTYTSSNFTHDDLTGFVANEHIDWTTDQGSTNIHAGNYTDTNTVYTDAEAISAVEGEATLDLSGAININALEFSSATAGEGQPWEYDYEQLNATGTNKVLELKATNGTGYIWNNSKTTYIGDNEGIKITSTSGAATTLVPGGGQNLAIGPNSSMVVTLEGDVTGDVTGDLTGNVIGGNVKANPTSLTIPSASNMWGWDYSADTGHALVGIGKFMTGHPIVGITQTDEVAESQPKAMFLVNHMDYDHSGEGDDLGGHGVSVDFNVQDEAGNLHQLGQNLVKLRNVTTGGSAGSSTITAYDAEYTLSVKASGTAGPTNSVTTNKDFTEVAEELRVVNKPVNSGSTALSGVYLTYDGAETGNPSAILHLRDEDADSNVESIKLEESRTTFGAVTKLHTASGSDPSGENGDMYYNTTDNKFRGYQNGAWINLDGS